jgi:nucleoside-diphosphate-sugar epimerase
MKALFIGGTGNISTAVSKLAVSSGIDLYVLNRGVTPVSIPGVKGITADIQQAEQARNALSGHEWDVVVNWIAFTESDIERDLALFRGKARQYIFISSASAYQKPATYPVITEATPVANPFWQYSRDKIACEDRLMRAFREEGFPMTVVRPSHTYDTVIPVAIGGWREYTIIDRWKKGKKAIIHGDGTALWTLTHADDFAKGFLGLMGNVKALGHAFHITSDEVLSWNQIYEMTARAFGCELNAVHIASDFICRIAPELTGTLIGDKAVSAIFDNSKIKSFVPGFQATISFQEGIARTAAWFEADAGRRVVSKEKNEMMDRILTAYGA